jgi:putative membrane protein
MTEAGRLHPLTLFFEAARIARSFIVPAVVGGASFGGDDVGRMFRWGIALLAIPALAGAIAKYASFRYRIESDELVLDSGVLRRNRRVIPLSRVQHIDVHQSALQRLTGVAELRVETAGGDRTEAVLNVLGHADAVRLRGQLFARRGAAAGLPADEPAATPVARLSPGDLALAGATANEVGLVAAALGGGLNLLLQTGIDLPFADVDPETMVPVPDAAGIAILVAMVVLGFLVIGWFFSIGASMVRYHGFALDRSDGQLRKRFGLLSRREAFIPLHRVQTARVEESVLRRRLGLASLRVETAGGPTGERKRAGAEAFVPIARVAGVPDLLRAALPNLDYAAIRFLRVHPRARIRAFYRYAVPILLLTAVLVPLRGTPWLWLLAALPLAVVGALLHYRHLGYALDDRFLVARSGFLNRVTWVVPRRKIQTMHVRQTPMQRRHRLASLVVDTAAGQAAVPDLHQEDARALLERLSAPPLPPRADPAGAAAGSPLPAMASTPPAARAGA